jgi:hypothetical protein
MSSSLVLMAATRAGMGSDGARSVEILEENAWSASRVQ